MSNTISKAIVEVMCAICLLVACAISVSAISAYNHGNTAYAIYATGQAMFVGVVAVVFAIIRAT